MFQRIGRVVLVVVLGLGLAVEPAPGADVKTLDPVVVTATKIETPESQLSAAVTVITEERLRTSNPADLGDVLRQVPGVQIQRSGGHGKTTVLRIRGATPQQVQVLVDGVRVKSPTTGLADLTDITLDEIERIEIVRGPQSTIYGADAIGGVVHIITKRGQGPARPHASVEGGNYGTHRERLGVSGSVGRFDYTLGGSWFESSGQFPNDRTEQRGLAGRLGLALPLDGHIGLTVRYSRTASELPFDGLTPLPRHPFFVLDPNAEQLSETVNLAVSWTQRPVDWFEVRARYGQFWNWLSFRDPATPADAAAGNLDLLFGETRSQIGVERREGEVVTAWHAGRWNTLTVGGEHRTESGDLDSVSGGFPTVLDARLETLSWFFHNDLRLGDRVILSGGRRWDDHSAFGVVVTHRAGAVIRVPETGTRLRASWGEGFRAPTINDLFFPGAANPDLRPERSESWDAGIEQDLWRDRVRLGLTYFNNRFRDLIQFTSDASLCPSGSPFGCPVNIGRARTQGIEVVAAVDLLDTVQLSGTYTFTDSEDLDTGRTLRRFPRHRYTAGLVWQPISRLTLYTEAQVVSSQVDQAFDPTTFQSVRVRNPGYHRIDLGGSYRIVERRGPYPAVDLTVRLNNATDARIMEIFGFRELGVNVLAGLQARY